MCWSAFEARRATSPGAPLGRVLYPLPTAVTGLHCDPLATIVRVREFRASRTSRLGERSAIPGREGGGANALVLCHHGCSVLGESVELAHNRAVNLEEAARATSAALCLTGGDPTRIPQVPAAFLAAVGAAKDGPV